MPVAVSRQMAGPVPPGQRNGYDLIVWVCTLRIAESPHCWQVGERDFRWSDSVFGDTQCRFNQWGRIQGAGPATDCGTWLRGHLDTPRSRPPPRVSGGVCRAVPLGQD